MLFKRYRNMAAAWGLGLGTALGATCAAEAQEAHYSGPSSTVVFSGVDFANDSHVGYTGLITALNRDLGKDGLMFRALGVYAGYEYDTFLGPSRAVIDGDAWIGDIMLGYQVFHSGLRAAVYVGAEYQDHDLTPDDFNNVVNGDEAGFKVVGELDTDDSSRLYVGLIGSYSTAFDSYWARARVGLRHEGYIFGVEGVFGGNEGYDNQRLGGFLNIPVSLGPLPGEISISGGYQFVDDDDDTGGLGGSEGAYGGIGYSFSF
jgi:hypothetical protein